MRIALLILLGIIVARGIVVLFLNFLGGADIIQMWGGLFGFINLVTAIGAFIYILKNKKGGNDGQVQ